MMGWLITTGAYKWLLGVIAVIFTAFFVRKSGSDSEKLKQIKLENKQNVATRKVVKEANEKIKSDDGFITDWLRDNGRFRK